MRLGLLAACLAWPLMNVQAAAPARGRPNVVLIIADDMGYGDLGCHGNPIIRTPALDRLAKESVRLEPFYVSPVCAPTRSSLLTGRYNYRTGVVDTFLGRALMRPDEVTLAEMLGAAGYRTGIFGKWHLGDNYPMRPTDQGFQEALVHRGGGIGQPSDPPVPGGGSYFDPVLQHNGKEVRTEGYCSDVFTTAAIDFLSREVAGEPPFFVYLAFNAPHGPLQVPEADHALYKGMNLAHDQFPKVGQPLPGVADQDMIARVYGMVTNLDANVARLLAALDALKLAEDTIVVFLTDNGPQQVRYNGGLRDRKASVFDGGIRVPCFIRWPGKLPADRVVDRIAAHIDITPTILDACDVPKPEEVAFDGRSLLPLLKADQPDWPDRTLYFQWHRGDVPDRFRGSAARSQRYKLVHPEKLDAQARAVDTPARLFDMEADPFELRDVAENRPELVKRLRDGYEAWFTDVTRRGFDPTRIILGAPEENPSWLTRQDWRGPRAGWMADSLGFWEVEVARTGTYRVHLKFPPRQVETTAGFKLRNATLETTLKPGAIECAFEDVAPTAGPGLLEAWITQGETAAGVSYVEVERIGGPAG